MFRQIRKSYPISDYAELWIDFQSIRRNAKLRLEPVCVYMVFSGVHNGKIKTVGKIDVCLSVIRNIRVKRSHFVNIRTVI